MTVNLVSLVGSLPLTSKYYDKTVKASTAEYGSDFF